MSLKYEVPQHISVKWLFLNCLGGQESASLGSRRSVAVGGTLPPSAQPQPDPAEMVRPTPVHVEHSWRELGSYLRRIDFFITKL